MQVNEKILNSIKTIHKEAVIIIRAGTFCNVYGKDAYIISYLFGYKLRRIQNNILSTGFPKEAINKVMSKLECRKIDYLVVNKKIIMKLKKNLLTTT